MKVELINDDFKASRIERAVEEAINISLKKLSLGTKAYKFAHNGDEEFNEIKWEIPIKGRENILKLYKELSMPTLDVENCGNKLVVHYYWFRDREMESLKSGREFVRNIESRYGVRVKEGIENLNILCGDYYWGNVENIIFE